MSVRKIQSKFQNAALLLVANQIWIDNIYALTRSGKWTFKPQVHTNVPILLDSTRSTEILS